MDKEKYQEELFALDWGDHYTKLKSYADYKVANRYFRHGIERKKIAKDAVVDSIDKLFDRDKDWNRERYPNAIDKLRSMVDTYFANLFKSKDYKDKLSIDLTIDENEEHLTRKNILPSDDNILEAFDNLERYNVLLNQCIEALENNEELEEMFLEIISGKQNQEIAESLNWKISKVENTKKKIKRRIDKIKHKLKIESDI